jgi:hypothetical protein
MTNNPQGGTKICKHCRAEIVKVFCVWMTMDSLGSRYCPENNGVHEPEAEASSAGAEPQCGCPMMPLHPVSAHIKLEQGGNSGATANTTWAEPLAELEGPGDAQAESPRCQFEQNGERCNRLRASSQYRHAFLANDPVTMLNHEFQRPTEVSASPDNEFQKLIHAIVDYANFNDIPAEKMMQKICGVLGFPAAQPVSAKVEEVAAEIQSRVQDLFNGDLRHGKSIRAIAEGVLRPFFTPVSQPEMCGVCAHPRHFGKCRVNLDHDSGSVCPCVTAAKTLNLYQLFKHMPDCTWVTPLPTGEGYWGCNCGLDSLLIGLEDFELVAPVTPVSHGPELVEAVKSLLEWMPKYSVGSSGYLRQERIKKALESFGEGGSLNGSCRQEASRESDTGGEISKSLLHAPNSKLPEGCYCKPGQCMAPVIMGRQMPCLDPQKAAATPEIAPEEEKA